jgi:hypothetical protein
MIDDLRSSPIAGFVRSALLLAGCVLAVALPLTPIALTKSGSGGLPGLALAAAVCLFAGLLAEALVFLLPRGISPLLTMLLGMAIRMLPPLGICLVLAAQGASGQQHLAFLCYLLAFYVVTLALETWLTVKRVAGTYSEMNHGAR